MIILKGFLVPDVNCISDLEMLLFEMQRVIEERASLAYEGLVQWQTERIVDEIALNQIKRPEDISILDMAANEVKRRVLYAERSMQCTEFNLYIGSQILIGRLDNNPTIYIKLLCPNDIYSKKLATISGLIPYIITEDDLKNNKSAKKQFWDSLEAKYQKDIPLTATLINYDDIVINPESFTFRSPAERAADLAEEKVMNLLLSDYSCGQQTPPNKLMEYLLQSMVRMNNPELKSRLEYETDRLTDILPEITLELVTKLS